MWPPRRLDLQVHRLCGMRAGNWGDQFVEGNCLSQCHRRVRLAGAPRAGADRLQEIHGEIGVMPTPLLCEGAIGYDHESSRKRIADGPC